MNLVTSLVMSLRI